MLRRIEGDTAAFIPDAGTLAVYAVYRREGHSESGIGSSDYREIRILETRTGRLLFRFDVDADAIAPGHALLFSPGGERLVGNYMNGMRWLIDLGQRRVETISYDGQVCKACGSPSSSDNYCWAVAFLENDELLLDCGGCLHCASRLSGCGTRCHGILSHIIHP
jgi:hypothetical protein